MERFVSRRRNRENNARLRYTQRLCERGRKMNQKYLETHMLVHKATWTNIKQTRDHDGAESGDEYQGRKSHLSDTTLKSWNQAVFPWPTGRERLRTIKFCLQLATKECGLPTSSKPEGTKVNKIGPLTDARCVRHILEFDRLHWFRSEAKM